MRLVDYLQRNARQMPDKVAVVCGGERYSYARLWQLVEQRAAAFGAPAAGGPRIIPFRASQRVDFLADYFAIHLSGNVAAPLEKNMPEALYGEIARRLAACSVPAGTADVLYTTGTTGRSKGVIISHRTIIADAENLIEGQGFSEGLTFVVHGPLNHIGSLSKLYPVIMLGATLHILDGLRDADAFFRAFQPGGRYATFFVPANIRFLLSFDRQRFAALADRLEFVESGGAPLSHADMQQLCRLLPRTRLYNTYASTETGIVATYNYNDGRCLAGCLGRPMRHSRVSITPEGLIACQGDTLMSGYVDDPQLTATVLRGDTVVMTDYGTIDDEGMLHIGGRESDVINVGGYKVSPVEVEDAAMAIPAIADCICISADHPVMGRALKLLVVMRPGAAFDKRSIARALAERLEPYKVPQLYAQTDRIERTYNGKLNRKHYC